MTRTRWALIAAAAGLGMLLLSAPAASAQVPPFFNGGGGIFDPEIDVIESGMLLDAQAVVSADRKYVTLTMRPQNTQLLSLQEFAFQVGGAGVPGGGNVAGGAAGAGVGFGAARDDAPPDNRRDRAAARTAPRSASHSPQGKPYSKPQPQLSPSRPTLDTPGMTLIARVAAPAPTSAPIPPPTHH